MSQTPIRMLALLVTALCVNSGAAAQPQTEPPAAGAALPVILLTGFEPFGPGRPANPSWEGIQALDGQTRGGFRLVCRRLPVVWDEPGRLLNNWTAELKPAAVFSFGQGMPGRFAIETRARKQRGGAPDNNGQTPPQAEIVPGGPTEYRATADCQRLVELLTAKNASVRLSTNAGAYLCEETLYTLEHLKATQLPSASVLFCHVPPLASNTVTAETIQTFVLQLLDGWIALQQAAPPAPAAPAPAAPEDPRLAAVKQFIEKYFRTWSNVEMDAYEDGFRPEATIQFIDPSGKVQTQTAKVFLSEQRRYQSQRPAKEVPLSIDIRFEERLARAVVFWKLDDQSGRSKTGFDHFTLIEQNGRWRIVNLVFYEAAKP